MSSLTEFLTGIANAIRNKKGTTEPINAQNFASEIESIETGTSGTSDMLQTRVDATNNCDYLFYHYTGNNVDFIKDLDTSNVTSVQSMFQECSNLTTVPQLDTSKVTSMSSMFYKCGKLTTIPQLYTSNTTDMHSMFFSCSNLTTVPQLDTSKVTSIYSIFFSCSNLTTTL